MPRLQPSPVPQQSPREFAYVIVREPDSFVLFKAYADNLGTVRLAEFNSREDVEEFVSGLPVARRVWL
jgi:hypothetical protein